MLEILKNKAGLLSLFFLIFSIFLLAGCSPKEAGETVKNKLKSLNEGLGEEFNDFNKREEGGSVMDFLKQDKEQDRSGESEELTVEEKEKIDAWLEERNLNKYGDSQGVYYPNGTPLMDSETGEKIERYDYILERYPQLKEEIKK